MVNCHRSGLTGGTGYLDTYYLPQTIIFIAFALFFSYLSFVRLGGPAGQNGRDEIPLAFSESLLFWLKAVCFFAVILSGVALIQSVATTDWWLISLMSIGLLVGFFCIDRSAISLTKRYPGLARPWFGAESTNGSFGLNGLVTNGNGNGTLVLEDEEPAITDEELTSLDDRDREMLRSIIRLDVTTVREVMVPRLDMAVVEAESPLSVVAETMVNRGHSRLPVYEEKIDEVKGVLFVKDLLKYMHEDSSFEWNRLIKEVKFIPENKKIDDLLDEFRELKVHIAIVVDEYGGTSGLVTMEDILEEIFGEINDEFDRYLKKTESRVQTGHESTVYIQLT